MAHTDKSQWSQFKGLGDAKLAQIKAAIEIGRRFREEEIKEDRPQIKNAKDVTNLLMPIGIFLLPALLGLSNSGFSLVRW